METSGYVQVKGAREHNLKNVSLHIPRDALVVFTGVSGSGKSSLAFGTLYAEAQKRYLESVSPYARRLFHQMPVPEVDAIDGLPPAVALQQQRGAASTRSSVGSVTTLSNLFRMLYSRAGDYPKQQKLLYAESFSPNTAEGACPQCHGIGFMYDATEKSMVPDDSLTIRERAIAAWPTAWGGQNLRDILTTLGYDVDKPWRDLPKKDRDWILFTEEQPKVPVYAGFTRAEARRALKEKMTPSYLGNFTGARRYVLHTFAHTQSALMKKRALRFMVGGLCTLCQGKKLKKESLSVKFAGYDIAEISQLSLEELQTVIAPFAEKSNLLNQDEKSIVAQRIAVDIKARLHILLDLGLGYLSMDRSTPTLSPGELQRLRLAAQVRSNLFGVVYVLDEPSAGLHPADTEALLGALQQLKKAGNSLFVVEHEIDIIRAADWIIDVGPGAGSDGGRILYSGALPGLKNVPGSATAFHLFNHPPLPVRDQPAITKWLRLEQVSKNNLDNLNVSFPLGALTAVTGVSGSGKSSLVSHALVEMLSERLGSKHVVEEAPDVLIPQSAVDASATGRIKEGLEYLKRIVIVDQKPIGRTPRSNLATYTGLFDEVRKIFAATKLAKQRGYSAGRFSFNVGEGRCEHCEGEGFVVVELLFLPSVYAPCPVCHGKRYNEKTLEIKLNNKNIAEVLQMTVNEAADFFQGNTAVLRALHTLQEVGLGYLKLGQPATELSGGEAQRIKMATELQRIGNGHTIYILDEPTTGLHPADTERLLSQLYRLTAAGNTVITVEHDMRVVAGSDWVIDLGPGAGYKGGKIIAKGTPAQLVNNSNSITAPYLRKFMNGPQSK